LTMGYPKIWGPIQSEPWYRGLNNAERGVYLQFHLFAKEDGDTGRITAKSIQDLSQRCATPPSSMRRILAKLIRLRAVEREGSQGSTVVIRIPQYEEWQQLRTWPHRKAAKRRTAILPKKDTKGSKNLPNRADQTRADQSRRELLRDSDESNRQADSSSLVRTSEPGPNDPYVTPEEKKPWKENEVDV
jgi:hypothetical protein